MSFHVHTLKNDLIAEGARNLGNKMFAKSQFFEALHIYNESLCYATVGSKHLSLAYGNRSAVYLETKQFEKCLENIKLARDAGTTEERLSRLEEREKRCIKQMQQQQQTDDDDPWNFFKLSYPPNKNYPAIVNCLEMRQNKKYGRYVITNQDLNPGDIIAIEETPFKALQPDSAMRSCAYCFKSNKLSLIPLTYCASAMVCSQECLERGKDKEMCAVDYRFAFIPRIVLEAIEALDGNVEKLKLLMKDPELRNKTVFDLDLSNPDDPSFKYNQLLALNSFQSTTANGPTINNHPVLERWPLQSDKKIIQSYMNHLSRRICHKVYVRAVTLTDESLIRGPKLTNIGSYSFFLFVSLLTYSCVPNIEFMPVDNKLALSVTLPIKKGEQIFCSWMGRNQLRWTKKDRQKKCLFQFSFTCSCIACLFNLSLKNFPVVDHSVLLTDEDTLGIKSFNEAKEKYKLNCDYIKNHFKNYPCQEIEHLLTNNKNFLSAIAIASPFHFDSFRKTPVVNIVYHVEL